MRAYWRLIGGSLALLAAVAGISAPGAAGMPAVPRAFRWPAARPTDHPDPARHAYSVPEAPGSPACSQGFCVHWVADGFDAPSLADSDGDGVPDYVESVLAVAEHVQAVENGTLGWRRPIPDGKVGGGVNQVDVYLKNLDHRLFGYAAPDRGQGGRPQWLSRRLHGYLVLDNDYRRFEYPGTNALSDIEVTFAHEYNHLLQMAYDAAQDTWFAEASAVWMEDQVYDRIDDYRRYVRRWVHLFNTPLTANSIREYGTAVWNEWLSHRYGRDLIRDAWARSLHTKPGGFAVSAYDSAIRDAGGPGFGPDLARFARDTAEWRTAKVFREGRLYPDMPRQGTLSPRRPRLRRFLNHATFELLRVRARRGRAAIVSAEAPPGVAAGLALVGRLGGERRGRVLTRLDFAAGGGRMAVRLADPARFQRLTAVIVNADTRESGFSARRLDWNYLTDRVPFRVRARVLG